MSDLQVWRDAFDRHNIAKLGWIRREFNIDVSLPNPLQCDLIIAFLLRQCLRYQNLHWVLRGPTAKMVGPEKMGPV